MRSFSLSFVLALAVLAPAQIVSAQATLVSGLGGTAGYGSACLGKNDDQSSAAIDLTPFFPAGLRFFSATHTSVFVNTNGNVSFSGAEGAYTPLAFPVADQPMIAPFWADVDIRAPAETCFLGICIPAGCDGSAGGATGTAPACHNPSDNGVWWYLEPGRMVVTWDRVGYYNCQDDPGQRMSFQLILTSVTTCGGAGDFDVEFRYNRCEWETGDASSGSGGFGGTEAQAGFDAGNSTDYVAIMGSLAPGISASLCSGSNVGTTGVWRFQIRSGAVLCPDAGMPCDTGMMGVCADGRMQCVASGLECRGELTAGAERCDALDNDCDGSVDEDSDLCAAGEVCDRGVCVAGCFEGGCPAGQACTPEGRCIDAGCESVTCVAGERCRAGACVGACDGITCPASQTCRAGRCVDLCETLTCDDCTVCVDGVCEPRCEFASCPGGTTCGADGLCLDDACVGTTCGAGTHCEGGSCVDDCAGATCGAGEVCSMGMCIPAPDTMPDAGVPSGDAGGVGVDSGVAGGDAGNTPAGDGGIGPGFDAGRRATSSSPGCSCRAASDRSGAPAGVLSIFLLVGALLRRRR